MKRDPSLIPLSHDHREGLIFAFRIRHGHGPSGQPWDAATVADQARETLAFFRNHLTPHFRAEEEVIFPVLEPYLQPGERVVAELREEHARLRALAAELEAATGDLPETLRAFGELLERHIRKEEQDLFVLFEERVPADVLKRVGEAVARILGRPPVTR